MSNEAIARELAALRPLIDELVWQLGSLLGGSVGAGFARGDLSCTTRTGPAGRRWPVSDLTVTERKALWDAINGQADQIKMLQADAAKHEQLIDAAGERIATLRFVLAQIRDLARAGRLDEIFTIANRALTDNPQQS